jgi:Holliday junction DNA helicase RuvA
VIGRLTGRLAAVEAEDALIDVHGVGYLVRCGARTLGRLGSPGDEATLHIEMQFSAESGPRLYGFLSREERALFRLLQTIQGVGPKAALGVLDVLTPADLAGAVARDDKSLVARASGVGPKLALRIITELKGKSLSEGPVEAGAPHQAPARLSAAGEAVSALMGLGISEPQARRAVDHGLSQTGGDADLATLIKAALQEVGR